MNNHNKLFSSGQTITLATGEDYTIRLDEVFINDHPYKKDDIEIALSNVLVEAPLTDPEKIQIAIYTKRTPSTREAGILLPFTKWEIDGVIAGTLAECVELINTAITGVTNQLLTEILAEIQNTNNILVNQTNVLLQDILDSNVMQEALITSTNTLLTDIRTDLAVIHNDNVITNQQLSDANTELDNITTVLTAISVEDTNYHTAMLNCLSLIKESLGNIDTNTVALEERFTTLISQTEQVETLLTDIVSTLNANSTLNVSKLEEIRVLVESINANTEQIETQLIAIIGEHDQTQVILNKINLKPNVSEILICGDIEIEVLRSDSPTVGLYGFNFNYPSPNVVVSDIKFSKAGSTVPLFLTGEDVRIVDLELVRERVIDALNEHGYTFTKSSVRIIRQGNNNIGIIADMPFLPFNDFFVQTSTAIIPSILLWTSNDQFTVSESCSFVKKFDNLGGEIVSDRVFYNRGKVIREPRTWVEGVCETEITIIDKAVTQKTILLDSNNPSITFLQRTIRYIDVVVLDETGILDISDGDNVVIPMSSDKIYKYDRNFDSYTDKVNPFDIKVDFTGTTGSILIEVGLI